MSRAVDIDTLAARLQRAAEITRRGGGWQYRYIGHSSHTGWMTVAAPDMARMLDLIKEGADVRIYLEFARPPWVGEVAFVNPQQIEPYDVGPDHRLLLPWEVDGRFAGKAEVWTIVSDTGNWTPAAHCKNLNYTYRVALTEPWSPPPAPLAPKAPPPWTANDFVPGTYGSKCTLESCGGGMVHPLSYFPLTLLDPKFHDGAEIGYSYKGWRTFTFVDFAKSHIVLKPGGNWQTPYKQA